jgi:hypothetical protein
VVARSVRGRLARNAWASVSFIVVLDDLPSVTIAGLVVTKANPNAKLMLSASPAADTLEVAYS